jgi:SAM-dependent methyltransferase
MPSSAAFDGSAQHYDSDFTHTAIGQWLRARVWERLAQFQSGAHVLEIGCGTGEDAVWLAKRGVHVVATDASPAMLDQTRRKAHAENVAHLITIQLLDLNALPAPAEFGNLDGVYSNFGAINCTSDWAGLADLLGKIVSRDGKVMFGVMSPFCLWETLWHGVHLDFKTASRRWNGKNTSVLADGATLEVFYPRVRRLQKDFASDFATSSRSKPWNIWRKFKLRLKLGYWGI